MEALSGSLSPQLDYLLQLIHIACPADFCCCGADGVPAAGEVHLLGRQIFADCGCRSALDAHRATSGLPLLLSEPLGLMWAAAFFPAGQTYAYCLLGPVLSAPVSSRDILPLLGQTNITVKSKSGLLHYLEQVPVLAPSLLQQYALMLHYTVCGSREKLRVSDLCLQSLPKEKAADFPTGYTSQNGELQLLEMIRTGDPNYRNVFAENAQYGTGTRVYSTDALRNIKIYCETFTFLCSRAAVQGGLPAATAFDMAQQYIRQAEQCKTFSETASISLTMYEDYLQRVRKLHSAGLSAPVARCCDFIAEHLSEKLTAQLIADQVGYTPYYFTRLFLRQTGKTLPAYLMEKRLEKAEQLLRCTDLNLQAVAAQTGFSTAAHLSATFKKARGVPPGAYRRTTPRQK